MATDPNQEQAPLLLRALRQARSDYRVLQREFNALAAETDRLRHERDHLEEQLKMVVKLAAALQSELEVVRAQRSRGGSARSAVEAAREAIFDANPWLPPSKLAALIVEAFPGHWGDSVHAMKVNTEWARRRQQRPPSWFRKD